MGLALWIIHDKYTGDGLSDELSLYREEWHDRGPMYVSQLGEDPIGSSERYCRPTFGVQPHHPRPQPRLQRAALPSGAGLVEQRH